ALARPAQRVAATTIRMLGGKGRDFLARQDPSHAVSARLYLRTAGAHARIRAQRSEERKTIGTARRCARSEKCLIRPFAGAGWKPALPKCATLGDQPGLRR